MARKNAEISNIRSSLSDTSLTLRERYMINNRLYLEYVSFQYDSACAYIDRNMVIAKEMGDKSLYNLNIINKVHALSLSGLLSEAYDMIGTIDTTLLRCDEMGYYYKLLDDYYLYKAEFADGTPYCDEYIRLSNMYRGKILEVLQPGSYLYVITKASYLCYHNDYAQAISLLKSYLPQLKMDTREYSVVTSILAFEYGNPKDIDIKKSYLAMSAISDLICCNHETTAIRGLADILFRWRPTDTRCWYLTDSL